MTRASSTLWIRFSFMNVAFLAFLLVTVSAAMAQGPIYDLGPGKAFGINNANDAVGEYRDQIQHAWPCKWKGWDLDGNPVVLPGGEGQALDINDSGRMVGWVGTTSSQAMTWTDTTSKALVSETGDVWSVANGLNSLDDIGGSRGNTVNCAWPCKWKGWDLDSKSEDLIGLGGDLAQTMGINDSDKRVGWSEVTTDQVSGFYSSDGTPTAELLPADGDSDSEAMAINNAGVIVGRSGDAVESLSGTGKDAGFEFMHAWPCKWKGWDLDGNAVILPLPGGAIGGVALNVNELGEIVGQATLAGGEVHAMLWTPLGGDNYAVTDLNDILPAGSGGWELNSAMDINDASRIVGYGMISGEEHAFMLVPEPAIAVLLSLGLGVLLLHRGWRRCRQ